MDVKAFKSQVVIGGVRARVDNSIGLSMSTPELSEEEAIALLRLKGKNVNILIEPEDGSTGVVEVESKTEGKTPSQRLRAILFVWWKEQGEPDTFDIFYNQQIEKVIDWIKDKLDG